MKRARHKQGSVVFDKRRRVWNYLFCENGVRRTNPIGALRDFPTKTAAWSAVDAIRRTSKSVRNMAPTVRRLVDQYRVEKMPTRAITRAGYELWLRNYILPKWGDSQLTDLQARPVELWLQTLPLSPKSKLHIKGLLSLLWDFSMWRGDLPTQRNPMSLVSVANATRRVRKPISLTTEQFQMLLQSFGNDLCWRTMLLLAVSFGLRISELRGLKWMDVDWLGKTLRVERGVVRQIVDTVKTTNSVRTMACDDELLDVLKHWKQATQFSEHEDWVFASPVQLGRLPLSYTFIWGTLSNTAKKVGIGHISSHTFRHTHRSWLDAIGTPVGVQQQLMRHASVTTTMNVYGNAFTADMREAHSKVVRMALPRA
jgi:integrase